MSLTKRFVPLKIGSVGVDTGSDPKLTDQALLRAENIIWPRGGAISKRPGQSRIDVSHTEQYIAAFNNRPVLFEHNLLVLDGDPITSGSFTTQASMSLWKTSIEHLTVPEGDRLYNACVVESGDVRAWAWIRENTVGGTYDLVVTTFERYSGRQIAQSTVVTPAWTDTQPRLVVCGGAIHYLYVNGGTLWIGAINTTTGAIAGAVNTAIGMGNGSPFDAVAVDSNYIIAASRDPAAANIVIASLDVVTPAYNSAGVIGANVDEIGVFVRQSGEAVIAYSRTTAPVTVYVVGYDRALNNTIASTLVATLNAGYTCEGVTGICLSSTDGYVFLTEDAAAYQPRVRRIALDLPGLAAVTTSIIIQKSTVASRPWVDNNTAFLWVTYDQERYAFLIGGGGTIHGSALQGLIEGSTTATPAATGYIPSTQTDGSTWRTSMRRYFSSTCIGPLKLEATRPDRSQCIEAQETLLIPGSLPVLWDGENLVEQGYAHFPETPTLSPGAAGVLNGTYSGLISYEWRDAKGRLHEICSNPATITVAGLQIVWQVPYLMHTRRDDVQVVLYRTDAGGTIYYRIYSAPNDKSALDYFNYNDNNGSVTSNPTLYTTGGVLPNEPIPQTHIQCEHQKRQFVVDDEYPAERVRYSKEFARTVAVEHASDLYITVPPDGGLITALASYLDRFLVFKRHRIYAFTGQGLTSLGTGQGYSGPYLISEAVGAINSKVLVLTPAGIMFAGENRVHVLNNSMQVSAIGDPVRYFTDALDGLGDEPVSAVHLPQRSLAMFLSPGSALAYNYLQGLWSTWTMHESTDGCEAQGLLFIKRPTDDTVRVENRSSYQDIGTAIQMSIETGWISLAGITGFKRVYRIMLLGQNLSSHTLHCKIAYDHDPEWIDDKTFASAGLTAHAYSEHLGAMTGSFQHQTYMLEVSPSKQKCTAIRLRIYDASPAGTNQSFEINAAGLVVGLKIGAVRVGASRQMG